MPTISELLDGAALGIQPVKRIDMAKVATGQDHVTQRDKESYADFLLSKVRTHCPLARATRLSRSSGLPETTSCRLSH